MSLNVLLLLAFVVAVLVGPFATLRLISHFRQTRADRDAIDRAAAQHKPYDDPD